MAAKSLPAFIRDFCFPFAVFGPVDLSEFRRFDSDLVIRSFGPVVSDFPCSVVGRLEDCELALSDELVRLMFLLFRINSFSLILPILRGRARVNFQTRSDSPATGTADQIGNADGDRSGIYRRSGK